MSRRVVDSRVLHRGALHDRVVDGSVVDRRVVSCRAGPGGFIQRLAA